MLQTAADHKASLLLELTTTRKGKRSATIDRFRIATLLVVVVET